MEQFKVFVDDNFHYMDEDQRYSVGEFQTLDEAVTKCQAIVEEELSNMSKDGMAAETLYETYVSFGKDPWIQGGGFSAWDYVKKRCGEICPPDR